MQMIFSLELLIVIFQFNFRCKDTQNIWNGQKNSDRVLGCHAVVEVALVGIGDEDVDKLPKEMILWHKHT